LSGADLFLRACRREPVERTPVWMMRQAGRYLPEYRTVREKAGDFVTLCKTPDLAAEVTIQPIDRLGVDAAILFSDILVPAEPMGIGMTFNPGPRLDPPVRTAADVDRLRVYEPEAEVPYVYETIRLVRRALEGRVPLIGFAAAPFTLSAYLVEGGGSQGFESWRRMLHASPELAHRLLDKVAEVTERYLEAQVRAGAQAVQVFDSWAGLVSRADWRTFSLPYVRRVVARVRAAGDVPVVYFGLNAAHLYEDVRDAGADVVGVDWRTGLSEASRRLGPGIAVQGNLDPCALLAPPERIAEKVRDVLAEGAQAPGHVFNLGHGILPQTPVEHAQAMVEAVKAGAATGARP
jgi:uroporphyrinogen decarboxylase